MNAKKAQTNDVIAAVDANYTEEWKLFPLPIYIFSLLTASKRKEKKVQIQKIATEAINNLIKKGRSVPDELNAISKGNFWGHMFLLGRIQTNEQERSS